jgi:predicted amidohydrolase YtcJ
MSVADLAIVGASIRTLDPGRPHASAVAMRDGVIVAVGTDAEVRAACDASTELIDGHGMALVPGLVDAHIHPFSAELTTGADLTRCASLQELQDALAAERTRVGAEGWVRGWGLDYGVFRTTGIDGRLLERAVGDRPALVTFMDCHTALASPRALQLAGVGAQASFAERAEVVAHDGVPTGELREPPAIRLVSRLIPPPTEAERQAEMAAIQRRLNAVGITGAHVMNGDPAILDDLRALETAGELTVRMVMPLRVHPQTTAEEIEEYLSLRDAAGRLWRGGVAKFFIDGVIDSGTAWLDEPDTLGDGTAPFWPDVERYTDAVGLFAGAGFQCATHAIGDRAVRAALDAYTAAPSTGVRHRIEHLETMKDADVPRLARESVVASMQPLHMQWREPDGSDSWATRLGQERAARGWRTGDLLRSGAVVALGSDWPVAGFDPRSAMAWARLRRKPGQPLAAPWNPEQAMSAEQALAGYTSAPAWAVHDESVSGRVAVGRRADLTAFAEDPVECSADALPELPVALTVVDGRIVFRGERTEG